MMTGKHNEENFEESLYKIFGKNEVDTHKILGIEFELLTEKAE